METSKILMWVGVGLAVLGLLLLIISLAVGEEVIMILGLVILFIGFVMAIAIYIRRYESRKKSRRMGGYPSQMGGYSNMIGSMSPQRQLSPLSQSQMMTPQGFVNTPPPQDRGNYFYE